MTSKNITRYDDLGHESINIEVYLKLKLKLLKNS